MTNKDDRIDDLLMQWEESFELGQDIPVETLCLNCPDLIPDLAERIAALKRIARINEQSQVAEDEEEAEEEEESEEEEEEEDPTSRPCLRASRAKRPKRPRSGQIGWPLVHGRMPTTDSRNSTKPSTNSPRPFGSYTMTVEPSVLVHWIVATTFIEAVPTTSSDRMTRPLTISPRPYDSIRQIVKPTTTSVCSNSDGKA